MAEWRLFDEGTIPAFTTAEFFATHPWVDPIHQRGHAERTDMVADLVADVVADHATADRGKIATLTDLGCGDGALLEKIAARVPDLETWGYDLGVENARVAAARGMNTERMSIFSDQIRYGDLIVATEVIEHLLDPRGFLGGLPGSWLVLSSPANENDASHYEHHAWAWDEQGYRELVAGCGWQVMEQRTCAAGFQAIFAARTDG